MAGAIFVLGGSMWLGGGRAQILPGLPSMPRSLTHEFCQLAEFAGSRLCAFRQRYACARSHHEFYRTFRLRIRRRTRISRARPLRDRQFAAPKRRFERRLRTLVMKSSTG